MTNDLMRDYITDGLGVKLLPWQEELLRHFLVSVSCADLPPIHPKPPTDPRERALRAKQQRGTGPDVGALKGRGRVTKYQTKG